MANWYLQNGKDSDVVISSRVRLARNLADFPFKDKAKQEDLQKEIFAISEKIYKAANPQGAEGAGASDAQNADPNVYEADYTDADDNK